MKYLTENELFLLEQIVRKNFSSKYKGSFLGIFWSVLKPLSSMVILTIVFSTIFHGRIENYPVYVLSGRCLIDFFTGGIRISMNSIKGNQNILQKTAAPKHIFIIGSVISEFLNFLITVIILVAVMIITKAPFYFGAYPFLIIPISCEIIMILGISFALSIAHVYYSDVQYLWGIVSQLLLYACAIFYPISIVPDTFRRYMILNPVFWFIDQVRCILMEGTIPTLGYAVNLILVSLIVLIIGLIIFKTFEKRVALKF